MGVGGILTVAIIGIFYLLGLWKKQKDNDDDRLIKILQATVEELDKKVNQQDTDIKALTKEVEQLKRDNENYIRIFQGRDKETQEFYKQGFDAIKLARETHDVVTTVAESVKNTNSAMEKLIAVIEKLAVQ